jgi:hypothetical protein
MSCSCKGVFSFCNCVCVDLFQFHEYSTRAYDRSSSLDGTMCTVILTGILGFGTGSCLVPERLDSAFWIRNCLHHVSIRYH